jgi:hypothetical protein
MPSPYDHTPQALTGGSAPKRGLTSVRPFLATIHASELPYLTRVTRPVIAPPNPVPLCGSGRYVQTEATDHLPKPRNVPFTAAQVNELIRQPKTIGEMPRIRESGGFARLKAEVLVEESRNIDLVMHAHIGLKATALVSPNVVLLWMNLRIRGIDEALDHDNIPGLQSVQGWHEHLWNDQHFDSEIRAIATPPLNLRALFKNAAKVWNIHILSDPEPTFDEQ